MINLIPKIFAADNVVDIGKPATTGNFFGFTCIANLVSNAVSVVLILSAIAFFVMLVMGGVQWLTSGGDKTKVQAAQTSITNAVIGLAIVASSYAIYSLILYFFGIDLSTLCTNNPIGG